MKKYALLAIAALCFLLVFVPEHSCASGPALDAYGGVASTSCTNPNGTKYFGIVQQGGHMLFCDPAGHLYFARGFAPFDVSGTPPDETGHGFTSYTSTKFGASSPYTTMDVEIPRMKSFGFNAIGPESDAYAFPYWPWQGGGTNPNKVPFTVSAFGSTCVYATEDSFLYAPQAAKNLYLVTSPHWAGTGYYGYGFLADYEDPGWQASVNGDAQTNLSGIVNASASDRSYLVGISGCDSDYMHGFEASPLYPSVPAGYSDFRLSYLIALESPVAWVSYVKPGTGYATNSLYPDPTVYSKKAWQTQLTGEYASIAALNTAWGSNYTTFGTSGTCYGNGAAGTGPAWPSWLCASTSSAYSLGTGNGTQTTFSGTLNPNVSPNSAGVFVNGVLVGGDIGNGHWTASNGGTTSTIQGIEQVGQQIIQQGGTGSSTWSYEIVAYSGSSTVQVAMPVMTTTTGPLNLSSTNYHRIVTGVINAHVVCSLYRVSFPAGSNVTTTGLIAKNGDCSSGFIDRGQAGDGTTPPAVTPEVTSGSINYATGALSFTLAAPPPSGQPVTVEYIQNGWQYGTGLMDEDGRSGHVAWVGNNSICIDGKGVTSACTEGASRGNGTSYASAGMVNDLNTLDATMAAAYAAPIHSAIQAYLPGALDFGPQPWGTYGDVPMGQSMVGMKPYVQVAQVNGSGGSILTQAETDYIHQNLGDAPLAYYSYTTAQWDSMYAWPNTPCSYSGSGPYTITCTAATPIGSFSSGNAMMTSCTDASYNNGSFYPATINTTTGAITYSLGVKPSTASTTCNLTFFYTPTYTTQAARAAGVAAAITALYNQAYSADGVHPWCTVFWWEYLDGTGGSGATDDFGLIDMRDNAYNGYETTTSTVPCNTAGETSYKCGGELRSGWGSDDGITPITNAFQAIDSSLGVAGGGSHTGLTNGAISAGGVK